jgi:predicted PurR-regulated permease PerM
MDLSTKNIFKVLTAVTLFLLLLGFVYAAFVPLSWLAAAFLIAVLLNPLVGFIQKYVPRHNRITAIISTTIILLAILILIILIMLRPLTQQFGSLIPEITKQISKETGNKSFSEVIKEIIKQPSPYKEDIAQLSSITKTIIDGVFAVITITILAIFMLINPERVVKSVTSYIPKKHRQLVNKLDQAFSYLVPRYFGGVIIIALIVAVFTFIPLIILGIPYPLALSVTLFFFDLIPLIGATLGYAFIIIFCLLIGNQFAAVVLLIYILIYQLFEDNIIVPLIQQKTVKISPLSVLTALLIGSAVFGMIGALLAIPAAAMIKITYQALKDEGYLKTD